VRRDICDCLCISEREVLRAIRGGALSLRAVGDACSAGTGCTGCHTAIEALLTEEGERVTAPTATATASLGQPALLVCK
jgi:bacterioferritin-associated ferredoxin